MSRVERSGLPSGWRAALFAPVDGVNLGIFRVAFGLLMLWEMIYLLRLDFVDHFLVEPPILFPYELTGWLAPMPAPVMKALIVILGVACALIAAGVLYRISVVVFALGFTYLFLLDKCYYNNHLYLICLLSFLFSFVPADAAFSWRRRGASSDGTVPRWGLLIVQLQIVIVYFYGGLAKINSDWLVSHQPVTALLEVAARRWDAGPWMTSAPVVHLITVGGMLFDLLVGFGLFWRPARPCAIAAAIGFNLTNAHLFDDINVFPFLMLAALMLYVDPAWTRRRLSRLRRRPQVPASHEQVPPSPGRQRVILAALAIYLAVQILVPFRHLLIPGPVDWTGEGARFAWRMKIQIRTIERFGLTIWSYDDRTQVPIGILDLAALGFNRDQIEQMTLHPEMLVRLARYLADDRRRRFGVEHVEVRADIRVVFNGRPPRPIVDPEADLAAAHVHLLAHDDWIAPLDDP